MTEQKILTIKDVKEMLHMGNAKVYKLFSQKSFPAFRINDTWYVRESDFYDWIETVQKMPDKTYTLRMRFSLNM